MWVQKKKCTLVQALRLCTGRTAHSGSSGIALLLHDHGTRRGWGVNVMPRPLFTPRKDPVPIVQEVGWSPGPVWTGAENLAPTGIWSLDRLARNRSLYRLCYLAHNVGAVGYLLLIPEYSDGAAICRSRHRNVTQLFVLWEEHFLYIMYAVQGYTAVTWSALLVCCNGDHQ
jgi:hypothetical protein